jgi:endonuclease/exonuclease/phosphatase family metal-dependent hydrolase
MKRRLSVILLPFIFIVCSVFVLPISLAGKRESVPNVSNYSGVNIQNNASVIKMLTLNIAHGRKDGIHQIFQSKEMIRSNLDDIVSLIKRENPDFIALQEADSPSIWSGSFDHIAYIAEQSGFGYSVQGVHVDGLMLSYGTALLSKHLLSEPVSVTFKPSPPTSPKGFVSADIDLGVDLKAKIVSLHLDFLRKSVREKQAQDMIDILSTGKKPLIVMGDFNCEWEEGSALQLLAQKLSMSICNMGAGDMVTFPKLKKRFDYFLISEEFEFVTYRVIDDTVSDHRGVIAEIRRII